MYFEPISTAKRIVLRRTQAMFGRVVVDMVQSGQIRFLKTEPGVAHVVPNLSPRGAIETVQLSSRHTVDFLGQLFNAAIKPIKSDEMIVIRKKLPMLEVQIQIRGKYRKSHFGARSASRASEIDAP